MFELLIEVEKPLLHDDRRSGRPKSVIGSDRATKRRSPENLGASGLQLLDSNQRPGG
jgi:hypothetical protein